MSEELITADGQRVVSAKEAADMLGWHIERFLSCPIDKVPSAVLRTIPTKDGSPWKESPDNEAWYYVEDIERFMEEQKGDSAKRKIDPQSAE